MRLVLASAVVAVAAGVAGCGSFGTADPTGTDGGGASATDGASPATIASSFCAGAGASAKRCIDFDTPAQVTAPFGFDELYADPTHPPLGTLSIVGTDSYSPPNSLRMVTPGGGSAEGDIVIDLAGNLPAELRVSLRLRYGILAEGESTSSHFLTLRCRSREEGGIYLKATKNGKLGLKQDVDAGTDPSSASGFEQSRWHHVEVLYEWGATPAISISLDGTAPFGGPLPLSRFSCSEPLVLRVGNWVSSGVGDYEMQFDDILVNWN